VSNVNNMSGMFNNSALSTTNLTNIYEKWSLLSLPNNIVFGAPNTQYFESGQAGRDTMVNTYNWVITDGGQV